MELTDNVLKELHTFKSYKEADEIRCCIQEIAHRYGYATRADYMELCDMNASYTDNHYGWLEHTLNETRVVSSPYGYFIEFPKSIPIRL